MPRQSQVSEVCCPFLEQDDPRCASHFSLDRLSEAFDVCVNGHLGCTLYYRLLREQNRVTNLTFRGQPFQPHQHLRATGT